jgi:hypothetical protein
MLQKSFIYDFLNILENEVNRDNNGFQLIGVTAGGQNNWGIQPEFASLIWDLLPFNQAISCYMARL